MRVLARVFLVTLSLLMANICVAQALFKTTDGFSDIFFPVAGLQGTVYQAAMTVTSNLSVSYLQMGITPLATGCPGFNQTVNSIGRTNTLRTGVTYTTQAGSLYAMCNRAFNHCADVQNAESIQFQWYNASNAPVGSPKCYNASLQSSSGGVCTSSDCGFSASVSSWTVN